MKPCLYFLIVLDRAINFVLGGSFNQTLSARAYSIDGLEHPYWGWTERFINFLIFWEEDHCRRQWLYEAERPLQAMTGKNYFDFLLGGAVISIVALGVAQLFA